MNPVLEAPAPAPSPALLRGAPARRLRGFDVASEVSSHALAWHIRDRSTGEEEQIVTPRVRGADVLDGLVTDVTSWVHARAGEERVSLRCFSVALRDAVTDRLDPDRFVAADLIELNASADWAHAARAGLRDALRAHEESVYRSNVLYAASDGSVHPHYGNGASAWVTSDGHWFVKRGPKRILGAELAAILSFADMLSRNTTHHRAVLFVDSLTAIEEITSDRFLHFPFDQDVVAMTRKMISSGRLELVWVRSHQGHLLNDLADRIALQRHRAVRSDLSGAQVNTICQRIIDGAAGELAATDWAAEAQRARAVWAAHRQSRAQAA